MILIKLSYCDQIFAGEFFSNFSSPFQGLKICLYASVPFCVCVCVCVRRLVVYYQLEEKKTPLGKTVYQSKVRSRIQLAGDKVNHSRVADPIV